LSSIDAISTKILVINQPLILSGFFIGYMFILSVYQIQFKMKKFFNIS